MSKLAERLKSPTLRRAVKQRRLVLDFTTAIENELARQDMNMSAFAKLIGKSRAWVSKVFRQEPNLTFFTAVELADAVNMDVFISVEPRESITNVISLESVMANDARNVQTQPVSQSDMAYGLSA